MTKLFASDFDGTLFFRKSETPFRQADLDAIRTFQETGGVFGACTGRPLRALTVQSEGVFPFDFYSALSGATLHNHRTDPLVEASVPREVVRDLFERYRPYACDGTALVCAADDYWFIGDAALVWHPVSCADSFAELPDPLQGFSLETETEEIAIQLAGDINTTHGDTVCAFSNLASIDVLPAGHSKGTGLHRAATHFGASFTASIGDSLNDLPLLDAADVAYTFTSAPPDLREHADVLVESVSEAIADFMTREP